MFGRYRAVSLTWACFSLGGLCVTREKHVGGLRGDAAGERSSQPPRAVLAEDAEGSGFGYCCGARVHAE
ncbi:MAG: hypothetical protein L0J38_10745, partial [Corynebacterium casei]|nr:hypothetical protein [Corynebacterium casei]